MIDRPLATPTNGHAAASGLGGLDVDLTPIVDPTTTSVENDDGSVTVIFGDQQEENALKAAPFGANLADRYLSEQTLNAISSDLRAAIDEDKMSRRDWEDALTKGLDLLGIKVQDRNIPWSGACGVTHPMILEAAVRFQSKSIMRLFPPTGPAMAKVVGESDLTKVQQAKRVAADINHWVIEKMPEYRDETEQLLFSLPIDGSAFKKVFYDPLLRRPMAQFVPASDFIMPYGFPVLETCPRFTHVMKLAYGDIARLQAIGFYRDIAIQQQMVDLDKVEEKVTRLSGITPSYTRNELITLWEISTDLMIEGDPRPYVVTMEGELGSNRVLSVYRNWREGDPDYAKISSWIHYRYVPWRGPYGLGLVHLIGGIGHSSTSILRQLVDAGTLSNLPGGLKARTMRIKGDADPIQPGEFRDVDVPAGRILDSIAFIPYKEPSAVLFQLLQMLVDEGKSFASIAELDITTSAQNAPVGTILALLERASEVITAVQSRMHVALGKELALVAEIIRDNTPPDYDYDPPNGLPRSIKAADYAQSVSIVPASDPSASTMAQRVMEYQSALQLSAQAPQLYDLPLLHRSMLEVLGIDQADQIVPDKSAAEPQDPVSENMALLTSKPVKAFEWQDHLSHIGVHMSAMNDPKLKQALAQNPLAPSIQQAAFAHINEHLAFLYRAEIQKQMGVPLPPLGTKLPAEVEAQVSSLAAAAAQKLLAQNTAQQPPPGGGGPGGPGGPQGPDPILQQAQGELQIRQQEVAQKGQSDRDKLQLEQTRTMQKGQIEAAKIASEERRTAMEIEAENMRHSVSEQAQSHREHHGEFAETTRNLMDNRVEQAKLANEREQNLAEAMTPPPPEEGPPGV